MALYSWSLAVGCSLSPPACTLLCTARALSDGSRAGHHVACHLHFCWPQEGVLHDGMGPLEATAVAVAPDSCHVLCAKKPGKLLTFRLESYSPVGHVFCSLGEHRVTAIAITPDGHRAITAGQDWDLRVWWEGVKVMEGSSVHMRDDCVSVVGMHPSQQGSGGPSTRLAI